MRRDQQNARAEHASDNAGDEQQREQAARVGRESVAIGDRAGDSAGKKRGGVGGVGRDGRHAGEEERGEGDKTAAAGDRVEQAGDECGEKEEEWLRKVHARE